MLVRRCKTAYNRSRGPFLLMWLAGHCIKKDKARVLVQEGVLGSLTGLSRALQQEHGIAIGSDVVIDEDLELLFWSAFVTRLGFLYPGGDLIIAFDMLDELLQLLETTKLAFDGGTAYAHLGVLHIVVEAHTTLADILAHPEGWSMKTPSL